MNFALVWLEVTSQVHFEPCKSRNTRGVSEIPTSFHIRPPQGDDRLLSSLPAAFLTQVPVSPSLESACLTRPPESGTYMKRDSQFTVFPSCCAYSEAHNRHLLS